MLKKVWPAILLVVFVIQSLSFYDPDFWWHIKVGELIQNRGLPSLDPFSYTMPSFPVVSHEWTLDILLNFFYINNLYWLLAVLFSILALGAIFVSVATAQLSTKIPKPIKLFSLGIFILSGSVVIGYMGIRPQVLSWFFLASLLYFLYWVSVGQKLKYLFILPLGFLVWANIHGSFAAGLATLAIFIMGLVLRTRKLSLSWLTSFILSVGSTLLNPYGLGIWREVLSSVLDSDLRWRVQEWQPSLTSFNISFICFVAFSLAFIYKYHKKFLLEEKLLYIFFLLQALASTRHVPLLVIVTTPLLIKGGVFLHAQIKKSKVSLARLTLVAKGTLIVFCVIFIYSAIVSYYKFSRISPDRYYPVKAVEYLENNPMAGNIFSEYSWGGYLIWHLPGKEVFIDGRMPSWSNERALETESKNAMDDYVDLILGKLHHKKTFEKYNINTVLWPKEKIKDPSQTTSLFDKLQLRLGAGESYYFDLTSDLTKNAWQVIYEDEISIIYQKKVE